MIVVDDGPRLRRSWWPTDTRVASPLDGDDPRRVRVWSREAAPARPHGLLHIETKRPRASTACEAASDSTNADRVDLCGLRSVPACRLSRHSMTRDWTESRHHHEQDRDSERGRVHAAATRRNQRIRKKSSARRSSSGCLHEASRGLAPHTNLHRDQRGPPPTSDPDTRFGLPDRSPERGNPRERSLGARIERSAQSSERRAQQA